MTANRKPLEQHLKSDCGVLESFHLRKSSSSRTDDDLPIPMWDSDNCLNGIANILISHAKDVKLKKKTNKPHIFLCFQSIKDTYFSGIDSVDKNQAAGLLRLSKTRFK